MENQQIASLLEKEGDACCNECLEGQLGGLGDRDWGQGHFRCNILSDEVLPLLRSGKVSISYEGDRWIFVY